MNLATPAALAAAIPAVLLAQVFTGLYLPTQLSNAHVGAGTAATAALGAVVMLDAGWEGGVACTCSRVPAVAERRYSSSPRVYDYGLWAGEWRTVAVPAVLRRRRRTEATSAAFAA